MTDDQARIDLAAENETYGMYGEAQGLVDGFKAGVQWRTKFPSPAVMKLVENGTWFRNRILHLVNDGRIGMRDKEYMKRVNEFDQSVAEFEKELGK